MIENDLGRFGRLLRDGPDWFEAERRPGQNLALKLAHTTYHLP